MKSFCKLILNENEIKMDSHCESFVVSVILFRWAMSHILWSWVRKGIGSSLSRLVRTTVNSRLRLTCEPSSPMNAFSHILVKLSSPSQKWRAFPETSAERFTFLPAFRSNVPFLSTMSHILKRSIIFISYGCVREFLYNCTEEWL